MLGGNCNLMDLEGYRRGTTTPTTTLQKNAPHYKFYMRTSSEVPIDSTRERRLGRAMSSLIHWDHSSEFAGWEAACLIVGVDPADPAAPSWQGKPVQERM